MWVVTIDHDNRRDPNEPFDPKLAFLEAHLAEHMAKVRAREDLVEVVMTVDAVTPGGALELAEALLVPAIEETGPRTGRVERVKAVRTEGRYVRLGSLPES